MIGVTLHLRHILRVGCLELSGIESDERQGCEEIHELHVIVRQHSNKSVGFWEEQYEHLNMNEIND